MNKFNGWKMTLVAFLFFVATAIVSPAQSFKTLVSFDGTDGQYPQLMPLAQGTDGNFYGTTPEGGNSSGTGSGTIFKLSPEGNLIVFHSFAGPDGAEPLGGLIQAIGGHFYGTTSSGGTDNLGTVFRIDEGGQLTTMYSFSASGAYIPDAPLIQASNGHFYGTTSRGGVNNNDCYTLQYRRMWHHLLRSRPRVS